MREYGSSRQPDLFARQGDHLDPARDAIEGPLPADFVERIRDELANTLACVREAVALPWSDLTMATLAELRFNSIAGWLPPDEAKAFRSNFQEELRRLYAVAEQGRQI